MKKIFVFAFILGSIFSCKVFAIDCSVQKAAIDNAQKNLDNAKKVLCGTYKDNAGTDVPAYSDMACNDKITLDFQVDPATGRRGFNIWGGFRKSCASDIGDLSGAGMCLYYDPSPDKFKFIYSGQTEPPLRKFCSTGNIKCPKDGLSNPFVGENTSDLEKAGIIVAASATNIYLGAVTAVALIIPDDWYHSPQRLENKWKRKYDGYGGEGVPKKKVDHHTDTSKEVSEMSDKVLEGNI